METNHGDKVCFVCMKPVFSQPAWSEKSSITGRSSVKEFTNALFVVSNVFHLPAERVENLMINFIAGRTKAEVEAGGGGEQLICDGCAGSIARIVRIYKEILATSAEIEDIKSKLMPGKKRRRKIKIFCHEDQDAGILARDGQHVSLSFNPESGTDDVDMEEGVSSGGDDGPSDDDDPPLLQRLSPKAGQPGKKRALQRPLDYVPERKRSKRCSSNKVKMTCPFCQTYVQASDRAVQFCKHLQKCSSGKSDSDLETLTCVMCHKFQSSDFLMFCEHFGACQGPSIETNQVIPIQNRLISCDCCPPPSCFKFYDYLQHFLYHQKNPMKCIHPLKSGVTCLSRWDCRTSYCTHWRKCHRGQPDRLPRPKSYVMDYTVPSIPSFCHLCNARFQSRPERNEHLVSCHGLLRNPPNLVVTCPHCPFTAHLEQDVSTHVVTEHPLLVNHKYGKRRVHSCDLCDHHFPSELALKRHKRLVHLIQAPKLPKRPIIYRHGCADCEKRFYTSNQLVAHRIREHNATDLGPDPNQCSICKRTFSSQSGLKSHENSVHGTKPQYKSCHHCGKMLSSNNALAVHLAKFHGEASPSVREFKCPREGCDKSYFDIAALKNHEVLFHLKTPLFNCEVCGKGYYAKQRLNRHLLHHKHPNFRPFSCDMCPSKTYRTPYELGLHWKSGHSKHERAELEKAGVREEQLKEFLRVVKEAGLEWNTRVPISIE